MKRIALAVVVLTMASSLGLAAAGRREKLDDDLIVTVSSGVHEYVRGGMVQALTLQFENRGPDRIISASSGPAVRVTERFHIPAGDTTVRFLYVPLPWHNPRAVRWCALRDVETGTSFERLLLPRAPTLSRRHVAGSGAPRSVESLAGLQITSDGRRLLVHEQLDAGWHLEMDAVSSAFIPDHWRGLSGVDVIIARPEVLFSPRLDLRVIGDWMAMGGVLLVSDASEAERGRLEEELTGMGPFARPHSRGLRVGIGGMAFVTAAMLAESRDHFFTAVAGMPAGKLHARLLVGQSGSQGYRYRRSGWAPAVPFAGQPPFWPVLIALTIFSIGIGPLGWWYLVSRKGMGLLYYVAAPALCAVVMGLVVAADIAHEGLRPYLSCRAVSFVDQRVRRRIDLAQFGIYAPFMVGGPLIGRAGEVPYFLGGRSFENRNLVIDATERGPAYVGALPARRKAWYGREATEVERRRLLIGVEEGRTWVENHLGCDLETVVISHQGRCLEVKSLRAGERKLAREVQLEEALRRWTADFDRASSKTVLAKAGGLMDFWGERFAGGHGWAARVAEGDVSEQVWLRSWRPGNVEYLMFGVY